jgi:hypothetical protein
MVLRRLLLGITASLTASLALSQFAFAAEPLPADSTARNGVKQHKVSHILSLVPPAPMPTHVDMPLHPHAADGLKRPYSGTPIDVLNYHYDNWPTGWNQSETDLTPATVGSASFGMITTLNVDGNVFAQPLMVSNFTMPDSTVHNVLIVATGHDTVYAYDAQTYAILWQRSLGTPQATNDVGCGDIQPEYGISSTPVILRSAANKATIYLIAATEPASFSFHTQVHAIDLGTGKDVMKPVEIHPKGKLATGGRIHFDPQNQWNRASLAYANGNLYVGVGSHCDNNAGAISGWVLSYSTTDLHETGAFNTIKAQAGYELSSIWMSGYAPAIDASGNVFAITGNGYYNAQHGEKGYGESIIELRPDLKRTVSTFTPSNFQSLNNGDTDFGSGGFMLIPPADGQVAPPMGVGQGKEGTIYVVDASNLGGLERHGHEPIQKISESACWCGAAYYVGPSGGIVFYQGSGDVLRGYSVNTGASPSLTNTINGSSGGGFGGSFPIVSTNGSTANTGVVWLIKRNSTIQLEAYNAASLGTPLFQQNAGVWSNGSRAYLSPMVANGRVYVPAYQTVTVFGLTD